MGPPEIWFHGKWCPTKIPSANSATVSPRYCWQCSECLHNITIIILCYVFTKQGWQNYIPCFRFVKGVGMEHGVRCLNNTYINCCIAGFNFSSKYRYTYNINHWHNCLLVFRPTHLQWTLLSSICISHFASFMQNNLMHRRDDVFIWRRNGC